MTSKDGQSKTQAVVHTEGYSQQNKTLRGPYYKVDGTDIWNPKCSTVAKLGTFKQELSFNCFVYCLNSVL